MEGKRPAVPIGIQDFREIRDDGYYYVDKSGLIADIVAKRAKACLLIRPRRFGKSLNLPMLDCFFNLEYRGNRWFDGLGIMEDPEAVALMNRFPVIRLDMKDLPVDDYGMFIDKFGVRVAELFRGFNCLRSSDVLIDEDKDFVSRAISRKLSPGEMQDSVRVLCDLLLAHHGVKPVVLIDEYDNPINNAFRKDTYDRVLGFLRLFYSGALKGKDSLNFAVVTGVMQIANGSIFSGLNSLEVDNVLSEDSDERYGFTPTEVQALCACYGRPDAFDEAKEWYDGYRFGKAEIYNPWSVLKYVSSGFKPATYWAGTSGNDIIDTLLDHTDERMFGDLEELANGRTVRAAITPKVTMRDIGTSRIAVYSVMVMSGYLNAVPDGSAYALSVPNREMRGVFASMMERRIHSDAEAAFGDLFDGLESGDEDLIRRGMQAILDDRIPFILLTREKDYQLIIGAAAMSRLGRYTVSLEKESGDGRADIVMTRNAPAYPDIVLELKRLKTKDRTDLKDAAEDARGQIREREYFRRLSGRVLLYGIAFRSKRFEISSEEIRLRLSCSSPGRIRVGVGGCGVEIADTSTGVLSGLYRYHSRESAQPMATFFAERGSGAPATTRASPSSRPISLRMVSANAGSFWSTFQSGAMMTSLPRMVQEVQPSPPRRMAASLSSVPFPILSPLDATFAPQVWDPMT